MTPQKISTPSHRRSSAYSQDLLSELSFRKNSPDTPLRRDARTHQAGLLKAVTFRETVFAFTNESPLRHFFQWQLSERRGKSLLVRGGPQG